MVLYSQSFREGTACALSCSVHWQSALQSPRYQRTEKDEEGSHITVSHSALTPYYHIGLNTHYLQATVRPPPPTHVNAILELYVGQTVQMGYN